MKFILEISVVLLLSGPIVGQTAILQLTVGQTSIHSQISIVDLGLVIAGERQALEIAVKNLSARRIDLDAFSFQDNEKVYWKTPQPGTGLKTRHTFNPGESSSLEVEVLFDDSIQVPQVSLMERGSEVSHFALEYIVTSQRIIPRTQTSETLPSGLGEWWSPWYRICLGPAPVGYTLNSSPSMQIKQYPSGTPHPRDCGAWAQCRIVQADDSDVCGEFTVQGHHQAQSLTDNARDETVWVNASISANYAAVHKDPTILKVTEVSGDRK